MRYGMYVIGSSLVMCLLLCYGHGMLGGRNKSGLILIVLEGFMCGLLYIIFIDFEQLMGDSFFVLFLVFLFCFNDQHSQRIDQ